MAFALASSTEKLPIALNFDVPAELYVPIQIAHRGAKVSSGRPNFFGFVFDTSVMYNDYASFTLPTAPVVGRLTDFVYGGYAQGVAPKLPYVDETSAKNSTEFELPSFLITIKL